MASQGIPTTMENLPDGVLSEIFIRLLAKQLSQIRCVCKSWNALLSESSFVKSHLHRSKHHNDRILLLFDRGLPFDCSLITSCPSRSLNLELTNLIKLPVIPQHKSSRVIGSVNGLICFSYKSYKDDDAIAIWNPSLSAVLTLPPCSFPSRDAIEIHSRFGYDPKTDDYKVVKLPSHFTPCNMASQGEIYSMRKGSWDLISQRLPSHITKFLNQVEVCVDGHDGHLHWLGATDLDWKQRTIVAIDLGAETFREIPLPDSLLHHLGSRFHYLGILAGKLCVMSRVIDGECEVWSMGEYGVPESWVKHHAFSQFSHDIRPYGFTSRNEFLFRDYDRFRMYDPIAAKTTTFKIWLKPYFISKIVMYVDSLVWIKPANR